MASFVNNGFRAWAVALWAHARRYWRKRHKLGQEAAVLAVGALLFAAVGAARLFRDVRIAWVRPERVGHLVFDSAFLYASQQVGPANQTTIVCTYPEGPIANAFWLKMVERNLKVRDWARPLCRLAMRSQRLPKWLIPPARFTNGSRDLSGLFQRAPGIMEFAHDENARAHAWLSSLGWREDEPFVCLLVRDSAYLDAEPGLAGRENKWRYHDYRDASIENFISAAEWLAGQGVWVIRMGKTMATPMRSSNTKIIDYAFRDDRSDFLDVWLFANCSLCISTGTGPDLIAAIYRRPLVFIDYVPAVNAISWANALTAPKPLTWQASNRRLTLGEMMSANFVRTQEYVDHGISVNESSGQEVLEVVQEAWRRSRGEWVDSQSDKRLNAAAWASVEADPEFHQLHGFRHPAAIFSSVWLRRLERDLSAGGERSLP